MAETVKNDEEKELQTTMGLIINAGNAKAYAVQAIDSAKKGDFDDAREKLKQAQKSLGEAHNSQTDMLTKEARGEHAKVSLLMVHGQDHLMTAITFCDLAADFVDLYETISKKG
ncbi:PTS lactose/cellobiose transporter subunit IIA [Oenococcus alcoholitolerans]|uniref:PTS cellobiose transporter subunit IIA n=1 Tax=Oenococcus alcoholitolerans TaxID=931074 RepID=A0ABR4XP38_9LACO|nr:PTS cellobiose transporter subunit IIA [Oenococcus alcoholitolerans]